MAKRKTPKVDLKPRAEKIEQEELDRIQQAFKTIHQLHNDVGALEAKKHGLLHGMANTQEAIIEMQRELLEKYGTFDIDISDGTLNYNSNEQADKKD